jgi:hypothetical protein
MLPLLMLTLYSNSQYLSYIKDASKNVQMRYLNIMYYTASTSKKVKAQELTYPFAT